MRLYRLFATLRSGLAAILAVAVIAGGALVSAAPSNPAPALSLIPRLSTSYHPSFPNTSTYQSALYVQNPGAADAVVVLTFYSATLAPFSLSTAIPAGATLSYARGEVPGLAAGAWWLEIVSDQELASVVEVYGPAGDRLAAYRGMTAPTASSQAAPAEKMYLSVFSPFFDSGGLTLWNVSTWNAAEVVIDLYQPDGSIQMSFPRTIPAGGVVSLYGPSAGVPAGCYTAVVSSTAPLVGLLNVRTAGTAPSVFELRAPLPTPATMAVLPRARKQVDEGGGPRTSTLYLTNHGSAAGAFAVAFYGADHALVTTVPVSSLPAFGMKEVDLATLSNLPSGTYSVEASGDQPVTLSEVTGYPTPPADHHMATYGGQAAVRQSLPRLAKTAEAYAIFSVQNPNAEAANMAIEYFDLAGQMVYNYALTLAPGGWQRHDLREISALPAGFTGSAVVLSDFPVGLLADDFYTPCVQPSGGQISRVPSGDLFPGDSVQFTANASGTGPFSYTWTVDAQPAGSDSATLDHTFQAPGPHAVGVTVTNACGQTTASLEVNVLEPPAPDLSTSSKTASQSAVDAGDTVTYTLILDNTGPLAASAVLTDPIPLYTDYVAGSAAGERSLSCDRRGRRAVLGGAGDIRHSGGDPICGADPVRTGRHCHRQHGQPL